MIALLTPWFWPSRTLSDASAGVRIGRLLHWTALAVAAVLLVVAAIMLSSSIQTNSDQIAARNAWVQRHADHPAVPAWTQKGPPPAVRVGETVTPAEETRAWANGDPPPYIHDVEYGLFFFLAGAAFLVALLGRGLRYAAGGE